MNQLNKLEKELQEYQDDESYWWDKAWDLSVSPQDRWEEDFNNHKMKDFYRRGILTSISAVILWVSLILACTLPYVSDFVQKVSISIAGNTDGILVVAMGLSSLITLVLLKMIKWYHTHQHHNFTHPVPKSLKVTADEEDDDEYAYIDKYTKEE